MCFIVILLFSEDLSRLAARKYARVIQKLGFPVSQYLYYHNYHDYDQGWETGRTCNKMANVIATHIHYLFIISAIPDGLLLSPEKPVVWFNCVW